MSTPDPTDVTQRIEAVWAETLTLVQPPEMTLRSLRAPDSSGVYGRSSAAGPATVRRVRPGGAGTAGIDYHLEEEIGRGGMGEVHRAWQESVGRRVALKLTRADRDGGPLAEERFRAEGAVTGALEHPGIVPVYDLGEDEHGRAFLAMKLVEGRPWSAALRELTLADNVAILLRVAEAVAFAHARGVIHADLKPANVMLGAWGEVLLLDWGLALRHGADGARPLTAGSPVGGTPAYMAPEQALQDLAAISPATDTYLLGAILYELAGGRRPHQGDSPRSCLAAAARNELVPVTGDAELLTIARRALAAAPGDRHPDVAAFIAELRAWRTHVDSAALLSRARALTARDDLAACADALRAIAEARVLWPGNPEADAAEGEVRVRWARGALQVGDAGLAASVARPGVAAEAGLHAEAAALAAAQRRQASRLRVLRVGVAALALLLLAGLVVGQRSIAQAETAARQAQVEAEAARDRAQAEAYTARLAQAIAALEGGDRMAAEAALAACPPRLRGIEWQVVDTRCSETPTPLPGCTAPAFCLAWTGDGRGLWVGHLAEAVLVALPEGTVVRRQALPAQPLDLACGPAGVLVGLQQGGLFLPADGGPALPLPTQEAVRRVALSDAGGCLWIAGRQAWRWRPGEAAATQVAEQALHIAWQDAVPVVATKTQVLVDGQAAFTVPDGDIVGLRWDARERFVLLHRGRDLDSEGNQILPQGPQAPDAPQLATYELRTGAGEVLLRAEQEYLDRDPGILPGGTGFSVMHARYHGVLIHRRGKPMRRVVLPEAVERAAATPDGTVAVAWKGGVAVWPVTAAHAGLQLFSRGVPIAMAYAGQTLGWVDCYGTVHVRQAGQQQHTDRAVPRGQHLSHAAQPWRLQVQPEGSFLAMPYRQLQAVTRDGSATPVDLPAGGAAGEFAWLSPDGHRYAQALAKRRCRIVGPEGQIGSEREGFVLGWLDDHRLLLIEGQDLVARRVEAWSEEWRLADWNAGIEAYRMLRVDRHLVLARDRLLEVRDPADGALVTTLDRHRHAVSVLAVVDDRLVSGDIGGNLLFWDLARYRPVCHLPWSRMGITALAGTAGRLAVGTGEYAVHLWGEAAP